MSILTRTGAVLPDMSGETSILSTPGDATPAGQAQTKAPETASAPAPAAPEGKSAEASEPTTSFSEAELALLNEVAPKYESTEAPAQTAEALELQALRRRLAELEAKATSTSTGQGASAPDARQGQPVAQEPEYASEGVRELQEILRNEIARQLAPVQESLASAARARQEEDRQAQTREMTMMLEKAVADNKGANLAHVVGMAFLQGVNDPREFDRLAKISQRELGERDRATAETLMAKLRKGAAEVRIIPTTPAKASTGQAAKAPKLGSPEFAAKLAEAHKQLDKE